MGTSHMKGEVMFENSISDPMVATTASLLGSKWSVLLLSIAMQDAMTKIFHFSPIKNPGICR